MFARNVGGTDRVVRIVAGAVLLPVGLFLLGPHGNGLIAIIVGALLLTSGIVGFCPPYVLFGISTARPGGNGERRRARSGLTTEQRR